MSTRWSIEQDLPSGERLRALEPAEADLAPHKEALAALYNHPDNRARLANSLRFTADSVGAYYREMRAAGNRPLLLFHGPTLVGDADFRRVHPTWAEFAILVGTPATQRRGLGTRFALMTHALAFRVLALSRLYVTIVPDNVPSLRLFARLGYEPDDSPEARALVDVASDRSLSLDRARFETLHGEALRAIRILPAG